MSDNWSIIKEEVSTYRNYVKNLPARAAQNASYCFLLTKEEIDRLLALKGAGHSLDGVRIYLGGNLIESHLVPTVHIVAVEKDGEQYNDYNVPKAAHAAAPGQPALLTALAPNGTGASVADAKPCPAFCSGSNILNS